MANNWGPTFSQYSRQKLNLSKIERLQDESNDTTQKLEIASLCDMKCSLFICDPRRSDIKSLHMARIMEALVMYAPASKSSSVSVT